eukprot:gene1833-biopygen11131
MPLQKKEWDNDVYVAPEGGDRFLKERVNTSQNSEISFFLLNSLDFDHDSVQFVMNSSHEEGARDRNRAGIEAADPAKQLRFQLDSGRKHPPRDMSSSENGHCYGGIDDNPSN